MMSTAKEQGDLLEITRYINCQDTYDSGSMLMQHVSMTCRAPLGLRVSEPIEEAVNQAGGLAERPPNLRV